MSDKSKTSFTAAGFGVGAAMGLIAGLILGGSNSLTVIITGQGSVGCTEVHPVCAKPCCPDSTCGCGVDRHADSG